MASFLRDVYYESFVTLLFSIAMTSVWGVSELLRSEFFPKADKVQLIGALLVGWLTFFGIFFGSAVVNPAVGLMFVVQKKLNFWRFLVYASVQNVLTLLGVLVVAAAYESYPKVFKGVAPPSPPLATDSPSHVFLAVFGVTFSVLFVGGLLHKYTGRIMGTFLSSVFYWVVAYYEAGAYSGAIMNPASILALYIYDKDLNRVGTWMGVGPKVAPYVVGSVAAAFLVGMLQRVMGGAETQASAGVRKPSATAAERRRRATKAE